VRIRLFAQKTLVLAPILWLASVSAAGAPQATTPTVTSSRADQAGETRYPVAHLHFGGGCRGYLYVSANSVRYEVVQPEKDKKHSFQVTRSEIRGVGPWIVAGQVQNAAEIRAGRNIYHFWLLPGDADVASTDLFMASSAAPAVTLIEAIQNPAGAKVHVAGNGGAGGPSTASAPVGAAAAPGGVSAADPAHQVPAGALEGIYVALTFTGSSAKFRRLNFNPDGWVVKDIPQEGMIGFNFTAYRNDRNTNRNWVGRYQVNADEIDMDWQDFRGPGFPPGHERVRHNEVSAHPTYDPGWDNFIPMCRCTGKMLSGKYVWGAAATDQYLVFFPNGTFIDHRVTDQLIVPSRFYEHPRIQQGTYSIQSQTIIFNFADGHRGMRTFMAPKVQENDPMFEWIGLGWQQLYEEGYQSKLQGR
jgi:hypothetical protein